MRTRKPRKPIKPKKPHKDFPLFSHATKRWAKKVLGKMHYFGPWDDPDGALARRLAEKDDLLAGRVPRGRKTGEATLSLLVNSFLNAKRARLESGELSPYTCSSDDNICGELITAFGRDRRLTDLGPRDFEKLRQKWAARWIVRRNRCDVDHRRTAPPCAARRTGPSRGSARQGGFFRFVSILLICVRPVSVVRLSRDSPMPIH